jgi:hypothetical protein
MSLIPKTLDEAVEQLAAVMSINDYQALMNGSEADLPSWHNDLGRWIRNNWKLWELNSDLVNHFNLLKIWHADDMSSIILRSAHRKYHNKPIELDLQIKHYKDYWENNK